jgi:hypothetical protein
MTTQPKMDAARHRHISTMSPCRNTCQALRPNLLNSIIMVIAPFRVTHCITLFQDCKPDLCKCFIRHCPGRTEKGEAFASPFIYSMV